MARSRTDRKAQGGIGIMACASRTALFEHQALVEATGGTGRLCFKPLNYATFMFMWELIETHSLYMLGIHLTFFFRNHKIKWPSLLFVLVAWTITTSSAANSFRFKSI